MSDPTTAVVKKEEKLMEYVPFGAEDKIKLSVSIVQNLIAVKTRTGKTCSETEAIKFMMMCSARRLNPFEGDAFLIGYDGKEGPTFSLITAHQAFLKRAEVNKEYDGMKSGIIVERDGQVMDLEGDFFMHGDKLLGGWATVYFKNRKQPMHKRIRVERFKKSFGIWLDDSAGMICKCAEADALRSSFPTMLGGLYLREEMEQSAPKTATPIFSSTPKEAVVVDEPREVDGDGGINNVKALRALCQKDGITEEQLVKFIVELGLADKSCTTLENIEADHESALSMIVEQWSDFSTKVKASL